MRAGAWSRRPATCAYTRRLRAPVDLPVRGRVSTGDDARPTPFSAEQAAAIDRRDGPLLLSANAGSGKTSVLVERFVRSVLEDGLAPGRILAITFTEKAAGELRDARPRAASSSSGGATRARDAEARVDLDDPRVLRAGAARPRGRRGARPGASRCSTRPRRATLRGEAFDARAGRLARRRRPRGATRSTSPRPTASTRCASAIVDVHDELRSRGQTRPRAAGRGRARRRRRWRALAAAAAARARPRCAGATRTLSRSTRRSRGAARAAARRSRDRAGDAAAAPRPARRWRSAGRRARAAGRRAARPTSRRCEAFAGACATTRAAARPSRCSTSCCARYAAAYAAAKRARVGAGLRRPRAARPRPAARPARDRGRPTPSASRA